MGPPRLFAIASLAAIALAGCVAKPVAPPPPAPVVAPEVPAGHPLTENKPTFLTFPTCRAITRRCGGRDPALHQRHAGGEGAGAGDAALRPDGALRIGQPRHHPDDGRRRFDAAGSRGRRRPPVGTGGGDHHRAALRAVGQGDFRRGARSRRTGARLLDRPDGGGRRRLSDGLPARGRYHPRRRLCARPGQAQIRGLRAGNGLRRRDAFRLQEGGDRRKGEVGQIERYEGTLDSVVVPAGRIAKTEADALFMRRAAGCCARRRRR
ncbi:MAG: hypothetical protein WDM81_00140 [Rhizomicrobium sp.]